MRACFLVLLIAISCWTIEAASIFEKIPTALVDPMHPSTDPTAPTPLPPDLMAPTQLPPDLSDPTASPPDMETTGTYPDDTTLTSALFSEDLLDPSHHSDTPDNHVDNDPTTTDASHSSSLSLQQNEPSSQPELLQPSDESSEHLDHSPDFMQHVSSNQASNDRSNEMFMGRLTWLARLYNAIILQSGLMNGTITVDDAIGQLLSIGSVKTADIINFDQEPIVKLIDKMVAARESMGGGSTLQKEDIVLANDLIQTFLVMGDLSKVPETKKYFTRIDELLVKIPSDALLKSIDFLTKAEAALSEIKDFDSKTSSLDIQISVAKFDQFKDQIKFFNLNLGPLKEEIPKWKSFFDLGDSDNIKLLRPVEQLLRIFALQEHLADRSGREAEYIIEREIDEVAKLVDDSKLASSSFKLLNELTQSRVSLKSQGTFNGVSILKLATDGAQKDWIGSALSHAGKANHILDGLRPIVTLSSKLEQLINNLDRVNEPEILKAFKAHESVHSLIGNLPSDLKDVTGFIKLYRDCLPSSVYTILDGNMQIARKMYRQFGILKRSKLLERDMGKVSGELDSFWSSVSSTDKLSQDKAVEVYSKLKGDGSLTKIKTFLLEILKSFEGFNVNTIKADARYLAADWIKHFWATDDFKHLSANSTCLTKLKNEAEQASHAVSTVLSLLKIDSKMVDSAKTGLGLVSQLSNGIKNLNVDSIVENMKQDATNETEKLSRIPPYSSDIGAEAILTKTALMLQDSFEFVKLKSSLDQLDVDIQIDQLDAKSPVVLKSIEDQWGNQGKDVDQLRRDMDEVEKFHSSINPANNRSLSDYGTPFNSITLNDIAGNVRGKSTAIELSLPFIPTSDTKSTEELMMAKKVLDRMDAMNLAFAKHRHHLKETQGVLQHLDKFLAQFLDEIAASEASAQAVAEYVWIIIICVLAAIVIGSGGTTFWMWRYKKGCFKEKQAVVEIYERTKNVLPAERLCIMITSEQSIRPADAFNVIAGFLRLIKVVDANKRVGFKLPENKFLTTDIRFDPTYHMNTRGYHGNKIATRTGTIFYPMQHPLKETDIHTDTREDFWDVAWNDGVEFIIMLNQEDERVVGPDGRPRWPLARYFSSGVGSRVIVIGKYVIEELYCENDEIYKKGGKMELPEFTRRVLTVTRITGGRFTMKKERRNFTHYQNNYWMEGDSPPRGYEMIYTLMKHITKSTKPIIVHCASGTGRTMAFIAMEFVSRLMEADDTETFVRAFTRLCEHRMSSFSNVRLCYAAKNGSMYFLCERYKLQNLYVNHQLMFERVIINREGVPEDLGDVEW